MVKSVVLTAEGW